MRVVHLPIYEDNPYQHLLMHAQRELGIETINGGGGGNFFRTALLRWKADVLHFHWLHPYIIRPSALGTIFRATRFLIELSILRGVRQRIVWTVHNLKNHDNRYIKLERSFTRQFARMASAVIAHSKPAAAQVQSTFAINDIRRIHVIPHGNYIGHYPNRVSRWEARSKLGVAPDAAVFLFFGRIEHYKGVLELIREFKLLSGNWFLVIAGPTADTILSQTIRNEIGAASNILFHSKFIPDEHVQFYMKTCDVVVLPYSELLTSGVSVLAMSFGKPCVAPRLGGMLDLLDERGAFLYDRDKHGALGEALRAATSNADKLSRMGAHNFAKISIQDWTMAAAATLKIYQDIC